ncbi:hypothetical protein CEXT_91851, partial [Caerostris extrusa]
PSFIKSCWKSSSFYHGTRNEKFDRGRVLCDAFDVCVFQGVLCGPGRPRRSPWTSSNSTKGRTFCSCPYRTKIPSMCLGTDTAILSIGATDVPVRSTGGVPR